MLSHFGQTQTYVESIIEKERPDGIMLAYGGQTALKEIIDNL